MGWVWRDDDEDSSTSRDVGSFRGSSSPYTSGDGERCATRKVVSSHCRTEEVEPGRFLRKCEKTEQIFKDCIGRPSEMVQSNKEYTEEDVTEQMTKHSFPFEPAEQGPSHFPGLRSDIEAIERDLFGGIDRFFQAAEEMKNEFFNSIRGPHISEAPPSYKRRGNNEGRPQNAFPKDDSNGEVDLSGLARDI